MLHAATMLLIRGSFYAGTEVTTKMRYNVCVIFHKKQGLPALPSPAPR